MKRQIEVEVGLFWGIVSCSVLGWSALKIHSRIRLYSLDLQLPPRSVTRPWQDVSHSDLRPGFRGKHRKDEGKGRKSSSGINQFINHWKLRIQRMQCHFEDFPQNITTPIRYFDEIMSDDFRIHVSS